MNVKHETQIIFILTFGPYGGFPVGAIFSFVFSVFADSASHNITRYDYMNLPEYLCICSTTSFVRMNGLNRMLTLGQEIWNHEPHNLN